MKNKLFQSNPINYIHWYKDGSLIKDESKRHVGYRYLAAKTTTTSVELIKRRKKFVSIHTNQLNSHKFISKLKIKVSFYFASKREFIMINRLFKKRILTTLTMVCINALQMGLKATLESHLQSMVN